MKILKYIVSVVALLALLSSCDDVEPEITGVAKATASNLSVSASGADINVMWDLPTSDDSLGVLLVYNGENIVLSDNPTQGTISNANVNEEYAITVKVSYPDGSLSTGITEFFTKVGPNTVTDFEAIYVQEDNNVTLTWTLPEINTASDFLITWDNGGVEESVSVASTATSYDFENVVGDSYYNFSIQAINGDEVSQVYYTGVSTKLEWMGTKVGFVITFAGAELIEDDDEIAAKEWFISTYTDGDIITTSDIATGAVNLDEYKVLWIHTDRIGFTETPDEYMEDDVLSKITEYYQNGGNLLLSIHATQYIVDLGRTERKPGLLASGDGGTGDDVWAINAYIGLTYDRASHAAWDGVTSDNTLYDDHAAFPFIGAGHREDHNSMWDLNSYGYEGNTVEAFEAENEATIIGTWGQVTDWCCAGIIDFAPTQLFAGRCIAVGGAAYEWNQNSGENIYQDNIEQFTKSSIEYLKN